MSEPRRFFAVELPSPLLDRLFRILYGPVDQRDAALAELNAAHPEHAAGIAFHVAAAAAAANAATTPFGDASAPLRRHWTLNPGTVFGPYRIGNLLGAGGMGTVFAAERIVDRQPVALKVLQPEAMALPAAGARFAREAAALRRLRHPGICEPLDSGEVEGCPYLAMRRVDGPTLAERIATARRAREAGDRQPPLLAPRMVTGLLADAGGAAVEAELGAVLRLVERLAAALAAAHGAGVVHRDVKPSNVLLHGDGSPVLVDFGLAAHGTDAALTDSGELLGTPAYMAPERLRRTTTEVGAAADIYALGAVLFECLTLRPPFVAANLGELLRAIAEDNPPGLAELRTGLPRQLERVAAVALARDPRHRYRTATAFAADLARVRQGLPIAAAQPPRWPRVWTWVRRHQTLVGLTAGAAVLGLGLAIAAAAAHRAERHADLLRSAALVTHAAAAEAELWPALPGREPHFLAWLDRFAAPDAADDLQSRLSALADACGIEPATALRLRREQRAGGERVAARDELQLLQQLVPSEQPGALPGAAIEAFVARRREWLMGSAAQPPPVPVLAVPAEDREQALLEALLLTAAYLLDDADGTGRPGAVTRIRHGIARMRTLAAAPSAAVATAWSALDDRLERSGSSLRAALRALQTTGLVPLGPDPDSRLEEFAHAPSGTVPKRTASGHLVLDEQSAIVLVLIPAGEVMMGRSRPRIGADLLAFPANRVSLRAFLLGKHEVSQAQWERLGGGRPSRFAAGTEFAGQSFDGRLPVENVSARTARTVLGWHGLKLPTEAQWEHAARAGLASSWPPDPAQREADNTANPTAHQPPPPFAATDGWDGHLLPTPIGSLRANVLGLFDLGGNVSEWCDDRFGPYLAPVRSGDGRRLSTMTELAVARGANFAMNAEPHHRVPIPDDFAVFVIGVRVMLEIDAESRADGR